MGQELPKWLRRKNAQCEDEPDVEWIRYYNTQFLARLVHHLESSEFTTGTSQPVRVDRRVARYLRDGSSVKAAEVFSRLAAVAMDFEFAGLIQPIALRLVDSVVGVSRIVRKGVFARRLTAS